MSRRQTDETRLRHLPGERLRYPTGVSAGVGRRPVVAAPMSPGTYKTDRRAGRW